VFCVQTIREHLKPHRVVVRFGEVQVCSPAASGRSERAGWTDARLRS
jgi:hypothetical protein